MGRAGREQRQLPRRALAAGGSTRCSFPSTAAGSAGGRTDRARHGQRRVRREQGEQARRAAAALHDHDRQPDRPHGVGLPEYLVGEPRAQIVAVTRGFRPFDGARFVRQIEALWRAGRPVIVYLAGRTAAGAAAAASHTAAVAGDHAVATQLARAAGAVVAESLEDFGDLVRLFARLRGRKAGAAGSARSPTPASSPWRSPIRSARSRSRSSPPPRRPRSPARSRAKLADIVAVHNPMDVTPILGDEGYDSALRAMLSDPGVDAAVLGCVCRSPRRSRHAPAGEGHGDDSNARTASSCACASCGPRA